MDSLEYLFFCFLESATFFIFLLIIFRLEVKYHILEIAGSSLAISLVSLGLFHFDLLPILGMITNIITTVLCLTFIFGMKIFYSLVTGVFGFASYSVIQGSLIGILNFYDLISYEQLVPNTAYSHIVQTVTVILTLIISAFTKYSNQGFGLLAELMHNRYSKGLVNKYLMLISVFFGIMFPIFFYLYLQQHNTLYFSLTAICLLTFTGVISFLLNIKDNHIFGSNYNKKGA